jgi:hypothetical protein
MAEHIKANADGSVTVTLASGIDMSGARVKVLTLREPTVADQIAAQEIKGTTAAQEVALIANLAQVTPDEIKGMTLRDYRRVQEALVGFTA